MSPRFPGRLGLALAVIFAFQSVRAERVTQALDADWRFFQGDDPNAVAAGFNDSAWLKVNVPHDWSIAGPFAKTNLTGGAGAFLPGGIVWYRKHFTLPENFSNQAVRVEFGGVMQNSDVWINGFHLGHRPNGYASFSHELDGHLNFGTNGNVIAVRCDTAEQPASRWYSGGGIYRHVRLVTLDPLHLVENGVFITTPKVSASEATVKVMAQATNTTSARSKFTLTIKLVSPDGNELASARMDGEALGSRAENFQPQFVIARPQLWDLNSPKLYSVITEILDGKKVLDRATNAFGIRSAEFTPDQGFMLNGKKTVIKGVCLHADGGAFGMAVPTSIWEERLKTLRSLGVNAIRTAHNPPAPEFLDLCDRMGFLVMDEFFDCWTVGKNPFDYHLYFDEWSSRDAADIVRRDRNHSSVILYSIGNEIHDTPKPDIAIPIASNLVAVCHANDPTRPVTQALFRPNVSGDYTNGLADLLDVVGTNYRDNELLAAQRAKPSRKIIGTEQRHDRQTWLWLRDSPSHSGQFLWTGVDYLGETRNWPLVGHASGLLDRTGAVKPMAFERESWWGEKPMVRLARRSAPDDAMPSDPGYGGEERHTQVQFADWTPRNLAPHDENVEVYSNAKEVELFLNGQSLGAKGINANAAPRIWKVPFAPGILKALARDGAGKLVAADELRTAGAAAKIVLSTETKNLAPGFDNVAIVHAAIVDENGIVVPNATNLISFAIAGPGVIAAVDNGDNSSHEPFQAAQRRAYEGQCTAFIRAIGQRGKVVLRANAPGLATGSINIKCLASE